MKNKFSFQNKNNDNGATLRNKAYNLDTNDDDAGPAPLQNKDFPEETFEAAVVSSNAKSYNIHDAVIAQKKLEDIEKTNSSFQNKKDDNGATLRNKVYNLYTNGKDAGPSSLQNKDFPEETFEAAIVSSNTKSYNIHDAVIAQKQLEYLLSQN